MRYGLLLITHGDAPHLDTVLESAFLNLHPLPSVLSAVVDGPDSRLPSNEFLGPWHIAQHGSQQGFCEACKTGWHLARRQTVEDDLDMVFWLENDFRLSRPVPIEDMALVLRRNTQLAQMALMRQPVNDLEKTAGGIVASRPGEFHQRDGWLEHLSFWTTNPSLIPARVFSQFEWPDGPQCEGMFGFDVKGDGLTFGFWGGGEEWVEHLGGRDPKGRGY